MIEFQDFVYELQRYADQTHILKDKFNSLSEEEKIRVMKHAPINQPTPNEHYEVVFRWLEKVQAEAGVVEKEEK